jgi:DNA polymerase III delta prime subunit
LVRQSFRGRPALVEKLLRIAAAGKLGQPFLLVGPEGSGKENTALEFARRLNCAAPETCAPGALCESCVKILSFQHPDVRWIGPAPATFTEKDVLELFQAKINNPFHQSPAAATSFVSIGDVENPGPMTLRSLIHFLRKRAFQGRYKVAIVADSQRLNQAAANAFLKTLEEPPADTAIFLLTTGTTGMLPTILSRCQKLRFDPWPETELTELLLDVAAVSRPQAEQAARTADGNARRALTLLEPAARIMTAWAAQLFDWIDSGNRAMTAISADELHRGLLSQACLTGDDTQKAFEAKEMVLRRDRAVQLCELLNLLYSDAVTCREAAAAWRPRFGSAAPLVSRASAGRLTDTLLEDMAAIEASRREIDRNLNIGLAMAVLFEGLTDHAERDQAASRARAR